MGEWSEGCRSAGCASDARSDADRCGHRVAGEMTFFFGFARPKTVFVIVACELLAGAMDDAVGAEPVCLGFPTGPSLWAFCLGWEEEFGVPTAVRQVTPIDGVPSRRFEVVEVQYVQPFHRLQRRNTQSSKLRDKRMKVLLLGNSQDVNDLSA